MKPKIAIAVLLTVTLVAIVVAAIIARRNDRHNSAAASAVQAFEVRGVIHAVDPKLNRLRIEHEEIPNYMSAMTMWLPVKRSDLLTDIAVGDSIAFRLEVTEDDSWISRIEKLAAGSPGAAASATKATSSEREAERVQAGERVPDFTITNQHGQPIKLSDFRGKAVVVNFIYTRCPLPNFCPALSRNTAALQKELTATRPGQFQIISITIDPEYDTPAVLKRYAGTWTTNQATWSFGTSSRDDIGTIASYFGLIHERATTGLIDHDLRTALISPEGKLIHIWKSNFWKPSEVITFLEGK